MEDTSKNTAACQTVALYSVYVMWCSKTDMHYVGVTRQQVATRIRQHKKGTQFVDKQIKEIGWEHWKFWVVEENVPPELISEREQSWIKFFNCVYPNGYNKTCGGVGKTIMSEDTRKKISASRIGKPSPNKGKSPSAETRAKIAAKLKGEKSPNYGKPPANKGVPHTLEARAKMSVAHSGEKNHFYGKHHTDDTKRKIGDAKRGKPGANKGIPCSESKKAILREKALGRRLTKETKVIISAKLSGENHPLYGKHHTEETKAKMREKALARAAAKRAAKAVAEENLAAANTAPTNLSNLLDAVILQQCLRSKIALA